MQLPHLAKLRDCARLLGADAQARAARGHYPTAVADLLAGFRLANAVADEPILISQLVRIAVCGTAVEALQRAFPPGELPPDLAADIIRELARMDRRAAFAASYGGEAFFGMQGFSDFLDTGGANLTGMGRADWFQSALAQVYASPFARPWFNLDQAAYMDVMGRYQEAVPLPFYEAKPLLDEIERDIEDLSDLRVLSRLLLPALGRACEAQARHEAVLDLTQLGLALELHFAAHGEYPATLNDAATYLGGAIPLDPFTGQSYVYRPSADTFLLYSLGRDLEDDGGTHDQREGDLVWRGRKAP